MTVPRRLRVVGIASAGMFLLAGAAVAAAGSVAARQARTISTIRVESLTTSVKVTHHPPGGARNDVVVERDRLINFSPGQFGKAVGAFVGSDVITETFRTNSKADVVGVVTLPGGTLAIRGLVTGNTGRATVVPVVGGTGKYAHARGSETVGTGQVPLNVFRLSAL